MELHRRAARNRGRRRVDHLAVQSRHRDLVVFRGRHGDLAGLAVRPEPGRRSHLQRLVRTLVVVDPGADRFPRCLKGLPQCPCCGTIGSVPSVQSPREIDGLLAGQLVGRSIRQLQVLGVNSLKTITPSADALVGERVRSAHCEERVIVISTTAYEVRIDLQRTGRVTWLKSADVWQVSSGVSLPSMRLLLDDGSGLDFAEPARTKRISVSLLQGPA